MELPVGDELLRKLYVFIVLSHPFHGLQLKLGVLHVSKGKELGFQASFRWKCQGLAERCCHELEPGVSALCDITKG